MALASCKARRGYEAGESPAFFRAVGIGSGAEKPPLADTARICPFLPSRAFLALSHNPAPKSHRNRQHAPDRGNWLRMAHHGANRGQKS